MTRPAAQLDLALDSAGHTVRHVAGVDEAGRGPLAGPVAVAAVILHPERPIAGLNDSKRLSERRRDALFDVILRDALAWSIELVMPDEIDRLNILRATLTGMGRALQALAPVPAHALVDGNQQPLGAPCPCRTLVGGDALEPAIMAASILAKVARDRWMLALHADWPDYGFARHKGYPTADHLAALQRHGPCPAHRRSFAPVQRALASRG